MIHTHAHTQKAKEWTTYIWAEMIYSKGNKKDL